MNNLEAPNANRKRAKSALYVNEQTNNNNLYRMNNLESPNTNRKRAKSALYVNEHNQNELQTNNNNLYGMNYYNQSNQSNQSNNNNWSTAYDPTSGRYYWYHTVTKQTSWYHPSQSMFALNISDNWNTNKQNTYSNGYQNNKRNSALLAQSTTNICRTDHETSTSQQPDQSLINELEQLKLENQRLKQDEKEKERLIEKQKIALLRTNKSRKRFIKEKEMEQKEILQKFGGMIVWEWMDDNGKWQAFEDRISNKIEKIYNRLSFTYTCNVTNQICKIKKLTKNTAYKTILSTNKYMICRQSLKMMDTMKNKYEWEWDKNGDWETYDQKISDMIENLSAGQYCSFKCYNNDYSVTKLSSNTAIQINTLTQFKRNVRKMPSTGSTTKTYPKWWKTIFSRSKQDYAKPELIALDVSRYPAKKVMKDFYKTVKNKIIVKIESVENQMLYDKYYNERETLVNLIGKDALNERQLYHGTKAIIPVQQTGFRKEFNIRHHYGQGTYFALGASYSCDSRYSYTDAKGITKIFQCYVICGDSIKGQREWKLTDWPTKRDGTGQLYDSLVDNVQRPFIFVIHENARAYPMFLIHFKDWYG